MYKSVVKRVLDFLLALAGTIVLSPLLLVLAAWVKLDSKGPVFFRQKRVGRDKRLFSILKFRSMYADTPHDVPTHLLQNPEAMITRSGRFLRRTSLDELPQLFNILKGDMSFVGPRPELLLYTTQYTKEQECILWVRPGITDRSSIVYIAQDEIVGTENPVENFEKYILPEKNRLRVGYALHQSFPLDVELFFETIGGVFGKAKKMADEKHEQGAKEPQK